MVDPSRSEITEIKSHLARQSICDDIIEGKQSNLKARVGFLDHMSDPTNQGSHSEQYDILYQIRFGYTMMSHYSPQKLI